MENMTPLQAYRQEQARIALRSIVQRDRREQLDRSLAMFTAQVKQCANKTASVWKLSNIDTEPRLRIYDSFYFFCF